MYVQKSVEHEEATYIYIYCVYKYDAIYLHDMERKIRNGMTLSLSDFIAPVNSKIKDYIGAFAVTGGINAEKLSKGYEKVNDDYNSIMIKTLADRLAEALAELMHQRVSENLFCVPHLLSMYEYCKIYNFYY